jgi:hypothetical protein
VAMDRAAGIRGRFIAFPTRSDQGVCGRAVGYLLLPFDSRLKPSSEMFCSRPSSVGSWRCDGPIDDDAGHRGCRPCHAASRVETQSYAWHRRGKTLKGERRHVQNCDDQS